MKVSIVIPSFNQAQYLEEAIRSVVEQEYPYKEIIVMDGGSTDGSIDVIRKYESHLEDWRSEPDGGQANAIASGFGLATGQIMGWINSDDRLTAGSIERLVDAVQFAGGPNGVFHGGWEVIDAEGNVQEILFGARMVAWICRAIGPAICQPGTFFGRDIYFGVGGVDSNLKYSMDFDLWMKFVSAGAKFVRIPAIQGQFRSHSQQKGHSLEWLKHCFDEEVLMRRRYNMAADRSLRRLLARQTQRILKLFSSGAYKSLAFRILRRHRLRVFGVDFSN